MLYIYQVRSSEKTLPELTDLLPTRLLVPPLLTNRKGWTVGVYETVGNVPVEAKDLLEQHCFHRLRGGFFDEKSNQLPGPVEPVGTYGLHSFRTIDDEVSDALGFDRAPD